MPTVIISYIMANSFLINPCNALSDSHGISDASKAKLREEVQAVQNLGGKGKRKAMADLDKDLARCVESWTTNTNQHWLETQVKQKGKTF